MSFRASSIYVSIETRRALLIVAKVSGLDSADEAAENLLSWALSEKYPALAGYQQNLKDMEKALIEELINDG